MKKVLSLVLVLAMVLAFAGCGTENGATVESREKLLDEAIKKSSGTHWTITKETIVEDYIISGAVNTKGIATLAVFEPTGNGKYQFVTSTNRNQNEPIISGHQINGVWFDFIWFGGAQTEYAEVTYLVNGKSETKKYDTSDMEIISIPNQEKEYTIQVSYFDSEGNQYKQAD